MHSGQFTLRHLFWAIFWIALALAAWVPRIDVLAADNETLAVAILVVRMALGWIAGAVLFRRIRLLPAPVRRLPLELKLLVGLAVLTVVMIAAAVILPPTH